MTARPPSLPPTAHDDDEDQPYATPWEELAAAYESLPAEDTDDRWVYLRKIAEVWEKGQHDVDRALEALERAFRLDITDVEVRAELERIGAEYDKWERIAEIYLGAIDEFGAIETSVTLHHDAARVRERLGQTDRAEELYRAILRLRSDDPVAIKRVEEICRDQQRWEDLANILEQRTGSPTEALPNGPERRARLRELAGLYEERLERPYEAIDTLERLLRESSDEERGTAEPPPVEETLAAHEALTRLYSRIGLWSKVVESLQSRADLTSDKAQGARACGWRSPPSTRRSWPSPTAPSRPTRRCWPRSRTTRRRWRRSIACTRRAAGSTTCRRSCSGARRSPRTARRSSSSAGG